MFEKYKKQFMDAMDDNFNTSLALTAIYDVLKAEMNDYTKLKLIEDFDKVLSLDLTKEEETKKIENEEEILALIEERNEAKKSKDYAKADQIRNDLLAKGIQLVDTKEGTTYNIIK